MNGQDNPMQDQQQDDEDSSDRLRQALGVIIQRLSKEAEDRVSKRMVVEKRWLLDLRQYYGEYDEVTKTGLSATPNKSSLFINATRPKTNACEAKIADMLFPTDDRNWGIQPTPAPHLANAARKAAEAAQGLVGQANDAQAANDPNHPQIAQQAQQYATVAQQAKAQMDAANEAAQAMQAEMESQLIDCQYQQGCRDMLQDATKIGTGIMKGPVANEDQARREWRKGDDGSWGLHYSPDIQPAFYQVDPWSFFPDPEARTIRESDANYERHLCTKTELRQLARQPGFDADAIRRLMREEAMESLPTYLANMRAITGENLPPQERRFHVWEYRGPLSAEEMMDMCTCMEKPELAESSGAMEADPLQEIQVVLWFCQDEVLKFSISHMDSGEGIYSVYNLEKDDSSIWGFGVPYWMRDTQKAMNGAWRMLMDNAGLCTGPQIEIDPSVIEPMDGQWGLTARKLWKRRENAPANKTGIVLTNIPSNITELLLIIKQSSEFMKDESSVSDQIMGDQGTTVQTARGTAILANAANVTFRRMIKNFDDDMTTPNIRRLYDWNMQFSKKENIKGDMEIDARGSSVLLVREVQSQNLVELLGLVNNPNLAPMIKSPQLLRKAVQSMMLAADDVIRTDDEIKAISDQAKQQPAKPDPDQLKAQTAMAVAKERSEASVQVATITAQGRVQAQTIHRDTVLSTAAQTHNMQTDTLMASHQTAAEDRASKERILAAEAAVAARKGSGVPV